MTEQRLSKKILNICIVCVIIVAIVFTAIMLILNYDVKGETNMPFVISKISIISTVDGQDVENAEQKWNINVIQNNDIYIYVEKNNNYRKQETIENVKIDNFVIKQTPKIGEIKIYKPTTKEKMIFENTEENLANYIEFKGAKLTDTKNLQISNQGGVINFRCANNNIGTYLSNDDIEINYKELMTKLNISEEDINAIISFDITLTLNSGKVFKAENIEFQIPNKNLIVEGTVGKEFNNLQNIVFKRIEN